MQIQKKLQLANGIYSGEVSLPNLLGALTALEKEKIAQLGEPVIECGGLISDTAPADVTLPLNPKPFPSGFPVKLSIAVADNADAAVVINTWMAKTEGLIVDAVSEIVQTAVAVLGDTITAHDTQTEDT